MYLLSLGISRKDQETKKKKKKNTETNLIKKTSN